MHGVLVRLALAAPVSGVASCSADATERAQNKTAERMTTRHGGSGETKGDALSFQISYLSDFLLPVLHPGPPGKFSRAYENPRYLMGGASSALATAEDDLLAAGLRWYAQWCRQQRGTAKGKRCDLPTIDARNVPIGDKGLHIHTVEYVAAERAQHRDPPDKNPLVCMHGFGTGIGIYYAALPALAQRWGGRVLAIDTLGCGLSSRPRWTLGHGTECEVEHAEAFFVEGLEEWREAMQIDRMVLMGHSLGTERRLTRSACTTQCACTAPYACFAPCACTQCAGGSVSRVWHRWVSVRCVR